nr:hypothetical protein [Saprospiraceae bacterium]
MKNYNNISLLIAVLIIGFFGGIAFVNNWLVLNKNYPDIGMFQIPFKADVWGTVSDWAMVLVTILTAIYLIKTFRIQQKQIKIQKREIKRNKRDVEFNRILDVVYRQLEFTRQIHLNRVNDEYGLIKLNEKLATSTNFLGFDVIIGNSPNMQRLYNITSNVYTFTALIASDVKLFSSLIYISSLKRNELNTLCDIVNNNFLNEYKANINDLNKTFNVQLSQENFIKILD